MLAKDDISHYWSSAVFYETGIGNFGFLSNIYTAFDGNQDYSVCHEPGRRPDIGQTQSCRASVLHIGF